MIRWIAPALVALLIAGCATDTTAPEPSTSTVTTTSEPEVTAEDVEAWFMAERARKARRISGGGVTISVVSEECHLLSDSTADCVEQLEGTAGGTTMPETFRWTVTFTSDGSIIAYEERR